MTPQERKARIGELIAKYPEPWVIEKQPHNYPDGTKEFTHVRYHKHHIPAASNVDDKCTDFLLDTSRPIL